MKLAPLAIAGSLAANLVLLAALALRPALAPPAFRDFFARHFHFGDTLDAAAPAASVPRTPVARTKLWAALESGDNLATLIARLRAAGFPASTIREMVRTQINARYDARMRAITDPDPNTPFWKLKSTFYGPADKRLEEYTALQRERSKLLRDLLGDPFFASDDVSTEQHRQFGNLSKTQIDQVQRIEDDYADMNAQVRAAMNGVTLPEDREKLALLAREKHADLAAILTPEELADYELRSSPLTNLLRNRLGGFDPTEAEYRGIFQAQQAFSDKLGGSAAVMSGDYETRRAAQQQLNDQLKAALGDARYADYVRETSNEFQQLSRLAQRDNVPAATAIQAYNLRDNVAAQSTRIADDGALDADQKRAELRTLAQNTRDQILATLGPTVGPAYVKVADQWLKMVENGNAVTFSTNNATMTISNGNAIVMFGGGPSYRNVARPVVPPRP